MGRQRHLEAGPTTGSRGRHDPSSVRTRDAARDGKTEARPLRTPRRSSEAGERLEHALTVLGGDAGAMIGDREEDIPTTATDGHLGGRAGRGVIDGIVDEDEYELEEAITVALQEPTFGRVDDEIDISLSGERLDPSGGSSGELGEVDARPVEDEVGRAGRREHQEVPDEPPEPIALGDDVLHQRSALGRHEPFALENLGGGVDHRGGGPQFVGRVRHEAQLRSRTFDGSAGARDA